MRKGIRGTRPSATIAADSAATTVIVRVPSVLRHCCPEAPEFALSASSVRGTLDELKRRYAALYGNICDETGAVRRHVNVFVNTAHVRERDGLDTPLVPGDIVTILPAVSGG